jgi:catechol 2,3-dioxygenase-like lactoylglutathione lyase family enzyme
MASTPEAAKSGLDAVEYGQSLTGLGINLLVRDLPRSLIFAEVVLGAEARFVTDKFAALRLNGADYMLHSDDTYRGNALSGLIARGEARGLGIELRVYNLDPDKAENRARAHGFTVLAGSIDKPPHGLRECMILDDEGYLWVPSVHLPA